MLLGYAVGEGAALQGIQPYDEVGGLDAALAGPLAVLLERLEVAYAELAEPATPAQWGERLQALLTVFFEAPTSATNCSSPSSCNCSSAGRNTAPVRPSPSRCRSA